MGGLTSLDEALARMVAVGCPLDPERVPVADAAGRVLAEPVIARIDAPRRDASAMDGYAVRDADVAALPARLRVTGQSIAGSAEPPVLQPNGAVRIFTGAPLPAGADRVVMQEHCDRDGDDVTVRTLGGANVRRQGEDFRAGDVLLPSGTCLRPGALVAAAGADLADVIVTRQPRVVLLGTGDELTAPGLARDRPGTIPESLSPAISAMIRDAGGTVLRREWLDDDLALLADAAGRAVHDADLVVVTGGASVGERDFARTMFGPALAILFSKVAMKPGKPVWLGRVGDTLVLGLPGNPSSALVTARLFLTPLVGGLAGGRPVDALRWRSAPLGADLEANGSRETLLRARFERDALVPLDRQDSSSQVMLALADALIRRPVDAPPARSGEPVDYICF